MKITKIIGMLGIFLLAILFAITQKERFSSDRHSVDKMGETNDPADVEQALGKLPLAFEANEGQTDDAVQFMARGPGYTLFLMEERTVLSLARSYETGVALQMNLVGANSETRAEGLEILPGISNYFRGSDPAEWQTNIAQYRKVRFDDVWPGIDVVYYGNQGQLEHDFVVAPGADPDQIRFAFDGAESLAIEDGMLVMETEGGEAVLRQPFIYQEEQSQRVEVEGGYALLADNLVAFDLSTYDHSQPLIIDPVLEISTFFGGSGFDNLNEMGLDADGNVYFGGAQWFGSLPTTTGAFDETFNGGSAARPTDAFVAKLDPTLSTLLYATYLGGSDAEVTDGNLFGLEVDAAGNVYLTSATASSDFPTTAGAFDETYNGSAFDWFVTKIDPIGSTLVYSTFIGGSAAGDAGPRGLGIDDAGSAYVVGKASSNFPAPTPGAFDSGPGTFNDRLVKLNPAGSDLDLVARFSGQLWDVAVDASGIYLVGSSGFFPTTPGAAQGTRAGGADALAVKLDPTGSTLIYATFWGGILNDQAEALEIDASGRLYLGGVTRSTDFPLVNPIQSTHGGGIQDAFLARLNATGTAVEYSTYLPGSGTANIERISELAVDATDRLWAVGGTASTDFPLVDPIQSTFGGGLDDGFVLLLSADGTTIEFSTYLGDSGRDTANGVGIDASGAVYLGGTTGSANFPTTAGAYQTTNAGADSWVAKFGSAGTIPPPGGALVIGSWDATRGPANATPNIGVIPPVMKSAILAAHPCATFVETGTLTPTFLSGVDVLLLAYLTRFTPFPSTGTPLSAAEQTALFDFVSGGGSVFLMGENIGQPSAATFFAPFGISVGGTPPNGIIVTDPFLSAATSGPHGHLTTQLAMGVGGAFTDPGPNGILIGTSGTFSTLVYVDFNAIAPGSGAVLGVNDSFPFLVGHIQPNNPGVCAWNTAVNNLIAAVDDGSCTDASVNCGIPLPPPPTTSQPPVAVCQDVTLNLDASGQATLTAAQVDGGSSDPDVDPITLSIDKTNFTCADIGENTVTLTVDDGQATATCTATVTVVDDTAPVPGVATLPDATGECSVTLTAPTATDNCAGAIAATTTDPTTYTTQGTFSVTWTYDDGNGNSVQQAQNVLVDDVTGPVITVDLISVPGDDDDDDEDNLFAVQCSATDNCSGSPSLTAIMQAPSLTNPSVEFKVKKDKKVKYDLKKNEVKVEGPDPQGLWAAVLSAGGVTVNDGQMLKLKTTGGDKHEFKFDKDGNLEEVKAPAAPTLVCSATDAAGNVSTETVSAALLADSDSDDDDDDQAHKLAASPGDDERLPSEFGLAQNHPNPFNPTTTITFAVPEAGEVTLAIYNMRGQLIQTLQSGVIAAGQHSVVWNGTDFRGAKVSSGVYVYQLKAKNFLATRKLVLTK